MTDDALAELLDRVGRQDADALRALYEHCAPKLYGLAMRVLGRAEWAEDALQESFLYVWRNAADFRASLSPPLAWMALVVRSRALDQLRRHRAQRLDTAQPLDEQVVERLPSSDDGPPDLCDASQQARALHGCLSQLDGPQRQVVMLAYLQDLSHGDLAAQLKLPLGTVKSWIRRGLQKLRGCMAQFT